MGVRVLEYKVGSNAIFSILQSQWSETTHGYDKSELTQLFHYIQWKPLKQRKVHQTLHCMMKASLNTILDTIQKTTAAV